MSGINIQQTSSIDQSNASYFFSDKDYAISNPIRSSSQNFKIEPNRTMAGTALSSQSGTYNFVIRRSQYNLIDLKDCMFVVSGTLVDKSQSPSSNYRLGCGWLLSLIDDAKLTIDNCVVSQNRNPALYSDIDAVLNHTFEELTNGSLASYGNQINKIERKKLTTLVDITDACLTLHADLNTNETNLNHIELDVDADNFSPLDVSAVA